MVGTARQGVCDNSPARMLGRPSLFEPHHMLKPNSFLAVPAFIALVACSTSDATPRQALGDVARTAAGSGAVLPLAAKNALDAGNTAYRARQYALAIDKYREAAIEAPAHAAPWFGVYMAANELKNSALADSAMARVKELSADPGALGAHAEVIATSGSAGDALPPGHPATPSQLPAGHPAPGKRP